MNNMLIRIIVALIAAPVILYSPFLGINYFASFIFLISFLGSKELLIFYKARHIKLNPLAPYLVSFVPLFFLAGGFEAAAEYSLAAALMLFTFDIFRAKDRVSYIISGYTLMIVYCGIFPAMLIGVIGSTIPMMFIFIYGVIIATDSFAYFGGLTCRKFFRTHKLLERISPKKTIEGSVSGLIFGILAGWLIFKYTEIGEGFTLAQAISFSAMISILGQIGDLFESMIKRDFGVKDSSNIIPGHGGVLDRFDSLIFVAPAAYIFIKYLLN